MVKILHAADFHLDSAFGALSEERARQRRQETDALGLILLVLIILHLVQYDSKVVARIFIGRVLAQSLLVGLGSLLNLATHVVSNSHIMVNRRISCRVALRLAGNGKSLGRLNQSRIDTSLQLVPIFIEHLAQLGVILHYGIGSRVVVDKALLGIEIAGFHVRFHRCLVQAVVMQSVGLNKIFVLAFFGRTTVSHQ